ncbi:MAG TPA: LON peptidase substrate-binding domain-containing protein [Phycisphaerae bacterium]|nr:LON peptidase substrate-binding domain-containing protein [Phycisphaerae bacterium]
MSSIDSIGFGQFAPVFPLPNAVLFPRAILPLHVFEPRYRIMTQDALTGSRLIAMALLKPGYEAQYHTLEAEVYPVVCVSRIVRAERLSDGRYNALLQGLLRAEILHENTELQYRRAQLRPLPPDQLSPELQRTLRHELQCAITEPPMDELAAETNWKDLLSCPDLCLSDLVDLLGSVALQTVEQKQSLLAEPRIEPRLKFLCGAFKALAADYREQCRCRSKGPRAWPPDCLTN